MASPDGSSGLSGWARSPAAGVMKEDEKQMLQKTGRTPRSEVLAWTLIAASSISLLHETRADDEQTSSNPSTGPLCAREHPFP